MTQLRALIALTAATLSLPACAGAASDASPEESVGVDRAEVVAGAIEPNYKYPWVVDLNGCRGVLVAPDWVLTAAHCVTPGLFSGRVVADRTDPYTGARVTAQRTSSRVFIHPSYRSGQDDYDVALVLVSSPFTISQYVQTVGIPATPKVAGAVATLAGAGAGLTTSQLMVFRAPIPTLSLTTRIFEIEASAATGSLCPGDSGSGLVTLENGRAVVRGIANYASITDCVTPSGRAGFADVFAHHDWLLSTLGQTDTALAGTTRVSWSGRAARGLMGLGCTNPAGTQWGPLNVAGVQEGADCPAGETQSVVCSVDAGQAVVLTGFSVKTTYANGTSTVQQLPFTSTWGSYYGVTPAGVTREFTCATGLQFFTPPPVAVLLK